MPQGPGHPLTGIVREGLGAASAGSLISATLDTGGRKVHEASTGLAAGGASVRLKTGEELLVTGSGKDVRAQLVKGGQTEPRPSGRFTLADGRSIVLEKGKVVGGDVFSEAKFAMFALLTDFPTPPPQ